MLPDGLAGFKAYSQFPSATASTPFLLLTLDKFLAPGLLFYCIPILYR